MSVEKVKGIPIFDKYLRRMQSLSNERKNLQKKIEELDRRIAVFQEEHKQRALQVSRHAILRFQERIDNLPPEKIKELIGSNELRDLCTEQGPGNYRISQYPEALIVIYDNVVKTVIRKDWDEQLQYLKIYMDYYIDKIVDRVLGKTIQPVTFPQFIKVLNERNRTTDKRRVRPIQTFL